MTAFLADPMAKEHSTGPGHPEQIARWDAAVRGVKAGASGSDLSHAAPRAATLDDIALCHTSGYIRVVQRDVEMRRSTLSTGDTDISPHSFEAALHAVGVCLNAVDLVAGKTAGNAFCVVRPPGHHARPSQGMGFCLFNNIAIAARYAQRRYGLERIAIADWDVHHGNGTQDIFYTDPSVFFFSTHQSPWYPGTGDLEETGAGAGKGTTLNCPFPAGSGREQILGAFRNKLAPLMDGFRPDLVMVSAGFDSRHGDPLGRFRLTDADFAELTTVMLEIADKHAGGRLISILEGGYNLHGLTNAVCAHSHALRIGATGAAGASTHGPAYQQ
jgi:acetoin utilization deacetylase AcuC-like enzyme